MGDRLLPQDYLHQADTRSPKEALLTDLIARSMSEINLARISQRAKQPSPTPLKNDYFFLCLTGIPTFEGEYENLDLPGERAVYTLTGIKGDYTEAQYLKLIESVTLEGEVDNIARIIQKVSPSKKIVMIFHSFGSYICGMYMHKYKGHRISGLVDLVGAPITMFKSVAMNIASLRGTTMEEMQPNIDSIYEAYAETTRAINFTPLSNKFQLMIFFKIFGGAEFKYMFAWLRQQPPILKLFVVGRRDGVFEESLQNEKLIFYSYLVPFEPGYELRIRKAYEKIYGVGVENVQERFMINFANGKHSVHMQKPLEQSIKAAIGQYLWIIDEAEQPGP